MEKPRYNAAIVPCQDYDAANVHAALVEALEAIGGLDWVKSGMTVGIKPNLASAKAPEYAVCTHPVMVAELARLLIEKGAKPSDAAKEAAALSGFKKNEIYRNLI